jgi:hypothetical protein
MLAVAVHAANGQVDFRGKVHESGTAASGGAGSSTTALPVSFATVIVAPVPAGDTLSAKPELSALSDINGDFLFEKLAVGRYRITVSSMGYETHSEEVRINFPSIGTAIVRNYALSPAAHKIDDVTVTASTRMQGIDRVSYAITSRDLKNAVHGVDLLGIVPQLSFDHNTQRLRAAHGGNVKILINGANASEQELIGLNAAQIKEIEFYDFPPARYAGYSNVVNVITRHTDDGLYGGVNLQHAFTTGFANDGIFLRYNWAKNQIALNASTNYRNYKNVVNSSRYDFSLNDTAHSRREEQRRRFGYDDNFVNLSYTRNVADKYMLQVNFAPNFQHRHIDGASDITQLVGDQTDRRQGVLRERSRQFSPSLDIYTSVQLPRGQELTFNVTGTYHDARLNYSKSETDTQDGSVTLQDAMTQTNDKKSMIGEAHYSKKIGIGTLAVGDKFSYGRLGSFISNSFAATDYVTDVTTNHLYAELTGLKGKLMYRLTLGGYYYNNASGAQSYDSWTLKPTILVGYNVTSRMSVRAVYTRSTTDPTLSELSANKVLISENIVREGNPALKHSTSNLGALMLSARTGWLTADLSLGYMMERRPINSYFVRESEWVTLKYENAKWERQIGAMYSFLVKPFKSDLIQLKLSGEVTRTEVESPVGRHNHLKHPLFLEGTVNYKAFSLSYQGNLVGWDLKGPYLNSDEKISTLRLRYVYKNLTLSGTCMWLLTDALYQSKTIAGSIVDYSHVNDIRDNRSMFTLGASWRFNVGRKYDETKRLLNNSDTDAGLFR